MDLRTYLRAIRKNWWIIVLAVALGAVAAIGYTSQVTKVYRSSVTFFVSTPSDANSGGSSFQADQYAQRRVESYVKLAKSDELAKRINSDSGLSLPLGAIESKISASADLNTVLMTVSVDDTSASRGLRIARSVATQFPSYVGTLQTSDNTVKLLVTSGPSSQSAPIAPRSKLYLIAGLAAGLLLGLMIALLREVFDTTLRSVEALKTLTDLPVLGSIPLDKRARTAPIVSQVDGHSVRAEAYRQVRTGVQFAEASARVQVLVVASSVAAEGKSSTSANIALTFAESGRRTLLVEADLRRPRVADYMSLDGAAGLTNVLIDQVELADVLQPWGDSGLTLLASGSLPPNPSELLGSDRMLRLLDELRGMFDVIVIDTPPLVPVTDGAVVAQSADGVVLVVRAGRTSRNQVLTALEVLESANTRILGCILSMVPRRRRLRRRNDSYAYYDKVLEERGALPRTSGRVENVLGYLPTGNPVPSNDKAVELDADPPTDPHDEVVESGQPGATVPPVNRATRAKLARRASATSSVAGSSSRSSAVEVDTDTLSLDELFDEVPYGNEAHDAHAAHAEPDRTPGRHEAAVVLDDGSEPKTSGEHHTELVLDDEPEFDESVPVTGPAQVVLDDEPEEPALESDSNDDELLDDGPEASEDLVMKSAEDELGVDESEASGEPVLEPAEDHEAVVLDEVAEEPAPELDQDDRALELGVVDPALASAEADAIDELPTAVRDESPDESSAEIVLSNGVKPPISGGPGRHKRPPAGGKRPSRRQRQRRR